ncbi:asr5312 [Nostoc sp. PCC 7120 = FACHB-418]|nr:asr5312 [Nostoc sp. PCC 7120 = FACHB-418]
METCFYLWVASQIPVGNGKFKINHPMNQSGVLHTTLLLVNYFHLEKRQHRLTKYRGYKSPLQHGKSELRIALMVGVNRQEIHLPSTKFCRQP